MVNFRNATREDYDKVKLMYDNMKYIGEEDMPIGLRKPLEEEKYEEYVSNESVILLEKEGNIIGFSFCFAFEYDDSLCCNLTEMFIEPEWRGRGYCRKFLEHIKEEATKVNMEKIKVFSENRVTDRLLPRLGFNSVSYSDEYELILKKQD